jgi:hypothetical protein
MFLSVGFGRIQVLAKRSKGAFFMVALFLTDICMVNYSFDGANTGWSNEREGFQICSTASVVRAAANRTRGAEGTWISRGADCPAAS